MNGFKRTLILAISLHFAFVLTPGYAQSWSAWRQLAEEQTKSGKIADAERSWSTAFEQIKSSNSKDSRLYISALGLAKILLQEKKDSEARSLLRSLSIDANFSSEESLECLNLYRELCQGKQDSSELARVDSLLEKSVQLNKDEKASAQPQVSLLFGGAARDDLHKKLGIIRQLEKQNDFAGAEQELSKLSATAKAAHDSEITDLVLREQAKLYSNNKEYKKAEQAYRELLEQLKQQHGAESQQYIEVLGTHARILSLLGETQLATAEQTKCAAISEKFKITPTGAPLEWSSSANPMPGSTGTILSSSANPNFSIQKNPRAYPKQPQIAVAPQPQSNMPSVNGRLRVIEFYTVW